MNPSVPYPTQAFPAFFPPNPNPNFFSKPDLSYSDSQVHPVNGLSCTLSSLKSLIHVADQTIQSLSDLRLVPNARHDNDSDLVQCAFDLRHRVPPPSLFRHSLLCPSAPQPHIDPTTLPESMLYPKNLESSHKLLNDKRFHHTLPDSDSDLCFSLNDYSDSNSNFFYIDCPAVVSMSNLDEMSKVFTLPRILAVECANFVSEDVKPFKSMRKEFRILASDLWALRSEVEAWNDYPYMYSHSVLCAILSSQMVTEGHLATWIITNSPRYGVVIDVGMRDHVFLLFRLCLMAISKEASGFLNALENGNEIEDGSRMTSGNQRFRCPILVQVLMWLACQLSVLYGEINGKLFAIDMLRQCVLNAASSLLLLPWEQKLIENSNFGEESSNLKSSGSDVENFELNTLVEEVRNNANITREENVAGRVIFVSQVAAAVAALHERFLLEEKIKGLRFSHLRTKYQLFSEHNYISQRAHEERKKRCDYRPIIEHDGLPKQQSHDEDTSKNKSREELLAEERDYKRRRMSYRGKKAKRSTLQVTRDIIEEYMEEIMKAGGIGCFVKGTEARGITAQQPSDHDITMFSDEHVKGSNDSYGAHRHTSSLSQKPSDYSNRTSAFIEQRKGHYGRNDSSEYERRRIRKDKYDQERYSRFSNRRSSPSRSHKQKSHQNECDNENSPSSLRSGDDSSARKDGQKFRTGSRWKRNADDNHGSESFVLHSFGDRYNPLEFHDQLDQLEDDYSLASRYINPDER